ncbi:DUF7065 domain-containing protein [Nocardia miyunensis]|uniref:DUF7065 domain-containing protein n=1 Tax=Nocardia miyunensis TaxID=282684 RepID=UPI000B2FB9C7|nr:hypothetical protein [Nocardia miyunensis]
MTSMTVTDQNVPFLPEDDTYHRLSDDPYETETTWWSLNVPERGIGSWLHVAYLPNQGTVIWRVFVWDPRGADPGRLAYYKNSGPLPMAGNADLRDIVFPAGGFSVETLTPTMDYHVGYADPEGNFSIEFEHRSVHAPQRFIPGEPPALYSPHFDQLGHITGELVLDGEKIAIDCHSVRDRTWGPRGGHHDSSRKKSMSPGRIRCASPAVRPGVKWSGSADGGGSSTSSGTPTTGPVS